MSNNPGLIWTIWSQDDGLIPADLRLGRLLNAIWSGLLSKLILTDIFMRQLKGRKVEDSGELSVFIDGVVMSGVPNLLSPNLHIFQTFIWGLHYIPKSKVCQTFLS
jgi:hypothetical protein